MKVASQGVVTQSDIAHKILRDKQNKRCLSNSIFLVFCLSFVHLALSCIVVQSISWPVWTLSFSFSLSILMAIFPGESRLVSFIGAKTDGSGGDNWSCKTCKAPVKSSPKSSKPAPQIQLWCWQCVPYKCLYYNYHHQQQTNTQLFTGRMSFLSPSQQSQEEKSTEGKWPMKTKTCKIGSLLHMI